MREYKSQIKEIIVTSTISTPLGEMFVAASKKGIVMLSFFTPFNIEAKIDVLKKTFDADVIPSNSEIFDNLKIQLEEYFNKTRKSFEIPLQLVGSSFQVKCWKEILNIPYGNNLSCQEVAINIGQEKDYKAVTNASLQNMIEILVPSHRVVSYSDELDTPNNIEKKEFLIKLESK